MNIDSNTSDPVDALLQQAFARELDRSADPDLVERINRRINREQKLRNLLLLGVGSLVLLVGLLLVVPAFESLANHFTLPAMPLLNSASPAMGLALAAVLLIAPWLYALIDDPI